MTPRECDIAIIGGGLSGGLIAAALAAQRPGLRATIVESQAVLGGNHRWSWFESDLSPEGRALLAPFAKAEWDGGYDVAFPGRARTLSSRYRSLASADFDAQLRRILPPDAILTGRQAASADAHGATLDDGTRIAARAVIDCRGQFRSPHLTGGWQVFLGRHLRTPAAHGVSRPIIMDATVEQAGIVEPGAYRFVYVLPLSPHDLFIEDTYYADSPELDEGVLSARIDAYCAIHGWQGQWIASETGILPVITGGDFATFQRDHRIEGVGRAGALGGFVHPLTSYSMPQAVDTALFVAANAGRSGHELAELLERRARNHWRATRFYRLLGQMLFGAARPAERWRIFERFYGLSAGLIERFYAAQSTRLDQARILCGKPPVPIGRALRALTTQGTPMARRDAA